MELILKGTLKRIPYAKRLDNLAQYDLVINDDNNNFDAVEARKLGVPAIGGDKPQFLKECHKQVCELYPDDKIEEAIKYFEELASDMGIKYTDSVRR